MKRVKIIYFLLAILCTFNISCRTVEAAEPHIEESIEEDQEKTVFKLSVKETFEGKAEPAQTYDYQGHTYKLEHADVEYVYDRRQTGETAEFTEYISLPENDTTLIPKEKTDGDIIYVLDESSLQLQITAYGDSEGTRIKEYSVEVPGLPDNDMKRLEKEIQKDGINYVLVDVEYTVTSSDENGIPTEYKALCKYEGAETYSVSIPIQWQTPARYVGYVTEKYVKNTVITATYSYTEEKEQILEQDIEQVKEEKTQGKGIRFKAIAAGTAGGILIVVAGYLICFTVPIYAAMIGRTGYKYVGRVRLKKKKDHYGAKVSSFITERAETNKYKIKIPGRILHNSEKEILEIECPDGSVLRPKLEKEVDFTILD